MKYQHPIRSLCAALEVSPSGYYDWSDRQTHPGPRTLANQKLTPQITTIFAASRQTYGSSRVQQALIRCFRLHTAKSLSFLLSTVSMSSLPQYSLHLFRPLSSRLCVLISRPARCFRSWRYPTMAALME